MVDCLIPNSLPMVKILMMSRARSESQAEGVLQRMHEKHNPQMVSDVVGLLVDQLIEDLCALEAGKDMKLERRR